MNSASKHDDKSIGKSTSLSNEMNKCRITRYPRVTSVSSTPQNTEGPSGGASSAVTSRLLDSTGEVEQSLCDELGNLPTSVIFQLDKANRTIASQAIEIERLRSAQEDPVETAILRQQVRDLENEMQNGRERFLEQEELLAEMSREMEVLLREKRSMQVAFLELEKKYKKAKMASKELTKILENDVLGTSALAVSYGGPSDTDDADVSELTRSPRKKNESVLRQSRERAKRREVEDRAERQEANRENERMRMANKAGDEAKELLQRVILENEDLGVELERERRLACSLQDDLEKNRRMVLERDEQIIELKSKLGKANTKAAQCESDMTRTSTDLALERARCDALTLELHEIDDMLIQAQSSIHVYAMENEQLEERCRQQKQTLVSLSAKLEAQGADLIATKKKLRDVQNGVVVLDENRTIF